MEYENSTDLIFAQVAKEYDTFVQEGSNTRFVLYNASWWDKWTLPAFLQAAYEASDEWMNHHTHMDDFQHCVNTLIEHNDCIQATQMTAKAGIDKHGDRAVAALIKELSHNLDKKDVIEGMNFSDLSPDQRKDALRATPLIKEKRDGVLKGRVVTDGRPQWKWINSEDNYKSFVHVMQKGKKILYVRLKRALYECIKSALLWWRTLAEGLCKEHQA